MVKVCHEVPGAVTAFIDAPHLREVQLSGASLRWISLPWIQLTSLKFSDESISNCLELLEQTPNLEVLGVGELTRPSGGMPHLTLSRLHTLEFQYRYVREGMLFDHLTLPALKTIQLSALEYDGVSRLLVLGTRS
ncbi:hypothetical protein B0H11DRAFT_2245815 [Mycena galericulata]|nr:hypothetical protein B0H11DRAFT_2245815 [Mycena galericulata]